MLPVPRSCRIPIAKAGEGRFLLSSGRSLMDWIRLTSTQLVKMDLEVVNEDDFKKHASVSDCWVLLFDKVYDVTQYLSFHPGGTDELMRAAGTDATALFNEYHPWVNYETMLKTCLIGHFKGDKRRLKKPNDLLRKQSRRHVDEVSLESVGIEASGSLSGELRLICANWKNMRDENISVEVREDCLRLLYHTNIRPSFSIRWKNLTRSMFDFPLHFTLQNVTFTLRCKKIENLQVIDYWKSGLVSKEAMLYREVVIDQIRNVTHDLYFVVLKIPKFCHLSVPIGHHLLLRINLSGCLIQRPYTPVLISESGEYMSFIIKRYKSGIFTSKFFKLNRGDAIEISDPLGSFDYLSVSATKMLMLAAGSGITPMFRLASTALTQNKQVTLLAFNKTASDAVADEYFAICGCSTKNSRLKIVNFFSAGTADSSNAAEFISQKLLLEYINDVVDEKGLRIFICGPDRFTALALKLLSKLGLKRGSVHISGLNCRIHSHQLYYNPDSLKKGVREGNNRLA